MYEAELSVGPVLEWIISRNHYIPFTSEFCALIFSFSKSFLL